VGAVGLLERGLAVDFALVELFICLDKGLGRRAEIRARLPLAAKQSHGTAFALRLLPVR